MTAIDAQLALDMLAGARRRIRAAQRCESLKKHTALGTPQYAGLIRAVHRELQTARMLLQAARRVHPATTPKGKRSARPVPPKTGPATLDFYGFTSTEQAARLAARSFLETIR